jgi:hypothetical protein
MTEEEKMQSEIVQASFTFAADVIKTAMAGVKDIFPGEEEKQTLFIKSFFLNTLFMVTGTLALGALTLTEEEDKELDEKEV